MTEHVHDLTDPAVVERKRLGGRPWRRAASLRVGRHTRSVLRGAALCALMTVLPLPAAAQLAPSVQADLYLVQTDEYIKEKNYAAAKEAMEKIIGLAKEHNLKPPNEFHFKYAQVLDWAGSYAEAIESLNRYLELAGQSGAYYRDALLLLHETMGKEEEAERQQADERRDDEAFARARRAGTAAAYGAYLRRYPSGRHAAEARRLKTAAVSSPGTRFRDCQECPELVTVPTGSFMMGSPASEEGRWDSEGPQHRVTIREPFAIGMYEVTRAEFGRFVAATRHSAGGSCETYENKKWEERIGRSWYDPGYEQTDRDPVVCVNWEDAQAYVRWLSRETGEEYRLPSEAEWEYAARAGTTTPYHYGRTITTKQVNGSIGGRWYGKPLPVGSFDANEFGLYDVHGHVWESTTDCWNGSYAGAPGDGRAWESGNCSLRVMRGGAWNRKQGELRSATRGLDEPGGRFSNHGFRVVRTLDS